MFLLLCIYFFQFIVKRLVDSQVLLSATMEEFTLRLLNFAPPSDHFCFCLLNYICWKGNLQNVLTA